jgi:beta-glucosidase
MGKERLDENHILATGKHFAGYSEPQQGLNGAYVDISRRTIYEVFLPPFEKAVKEAQVGCIMPAHSDLNGTPSHMDQWLLAGLLRNEWGFDGYIESDNNDIYRLHAMHRVAESKSI